MYADIIVGMAVVVTFGRGGIKTSRYKRNTTSVG
jgi:hypothetical protein